MAEQPHVPEFPAGAAITRITPSPRDPNMRQIRVDGRMVARLRAADIEALDLTVGQAWTDTLAAQVRQLLHVERARRAALTMLGRRAMSRGELINRLQRRKYDDAICARVADELERDHWLDDAAYAASLAEELAQRRSASHAMIVEKLTRRHIDEALARAAAKRVLGGVDPVEQAAELARKRLQSMPSVPPQRAARRIAASLARRGFDDETIAAALERMNLPIEPEQ